jgi:hypothetical protein
MPTAGIGEATTNCLWSSGNESPVPLEADTREVVLTMGVQVHRGQANKEVGYLSSVIKDTTARV